MRGSIEAAGTAGKEVHGWGFHYSTSEDYARKEGEVAAGLCESLSLSGYHWNAEKEWAASDEPDDNAIAFAQSFRLRAPGVKLFANCFNAPVNEVMIGHFDYYEPMIYGTRISTIAGKFQKRFSTPSVDESTLRILSKRGGTLTPLAIALMNLDSTALFEALNPSTLISSELG